MLANTEASKQCETVRALYYFLDGGVYHRGYIQEIEWDVFEQLNRPGMPLGFLVSQEDPLGSEYPNVIHPDGLTLWHGQLIWEGRKQ